MRSRKIVSAVAVTALVALASAASAATRHRAPAVQAQAGSPLAHVPEQGKILGRAQAPVTLVVFSDLQCPPCGSFLLGTLPKLLDRWVLTGKVRLEYRSLQTATGSPQEFAKEAIAASAAGAQDAEWLFAEAFLRAQKEEGTEYATESFLDGIAAQIPGLDLAKWKVDRTDPRYRSQLRADAALAARHRLNGTPSFLLGRTGRRMRAFEPGSFAAREFAKGFEAVLRRR
jgi:protein-disulfide isomerase